ncbi:MAG: peptidoglycan-binding protein, partial [Leptolyngbya sp. SIO3F4]|nr:peptidoglycan-binding protein [Leptolyngbya sp. SIO3F4]
MTKRGTGWVPDFPDVKDYTLNGQQGQTLLNQLQTNEDMKSHEETAEQMAQALKLLQSQSQLSEQSDNNNERRNSKKLKDLIKELDKKADGGIFFADIKIHKVYEQGMSDPEVLRIKKYLHSIYADFLGGNRSFNIFDSTFDELTKSLVEDFQTNRRLPTDREPDGVVDI